MAETANTAFTVKVDDRTFTLDKITLGDWRRFKTEFGLSAQDIIVSVPTGDGKTVDVLNVYDPSVLVALIAAALSHEQPHRPFADVLAEVDALGMEGLEFPDLNGEADADEADPQKDGPDAEAAVAPSKAGKSAKPRKSSGSPR